MDKIVLMIKMQIACWLVMLSLALGVQSQEPEPEVMVMVAATMEYDREDGWHGVAKFQVSGSLADTLIGEAGADNDAYFHQFVSSRFSGWQVGDVQVSTNQDEQATLTIAAHIANKKLVTPQDNTFAIPANMGYQPYALSGKKLPPAVYTEYLLFQTGYPEDVTRVKMPQRKMAEGNGQHCSFSFAPASGGRNFTSTFTLKFKPRSGSCTSMLSKAYATTNEAYFRLTMNDQ